MDVNFNSSSIGRLHLEYEESIKKLERKLLEIDDQISEVETDEEADRLADEYDKLYDRLEYFKSQLVLCRMHLGFYRN